MIRAGQIKLFLLWWLICLVPGISAASSLHVLLVLSDNQTLYQNFANSFKENLPPTVEVAALGQSGDFSGDARAVDLIVTVGIKAAEAVAGRTAKPLLAAMIPRHRYADLLAQRPAGAHTTAIYLDQSWARQAELLRSALPERPRIGVLHSPATRLDLNDLRKQLEKRGASLVARQANSAASLFEDLEYVLARTDVLLAVPDSEIYNSNNIRNILLTSYRRGIPLVGFSQAYVNAGALLALFSTPEQLAGQARAVTLSFAQTSSLPEPQFPTQYSIAVNHEVSRALGSMIKSPDLLRLQIEKMPGTVK